MGNYLGFGNYNVEDKVITWKRETEEEMVERIEKNDRERERARVKELEKIAYNLSEEEKGEKEIQMELELYDMYLRKLTHASFYRPDSETSLLKKRDVYKNNVASFIDIKFPYKIEPLQYDFITSVIINSNEPLKLTLTGIETEYTSWDIVPGVNVIELYDCPFNVFHTANTELFLKCSKEHIKGKLRVEICTQEDARKYRESVYIPRDYSGYTIFVTNGNFYTDKSLKKRKDDLQQKLVEIKREKEIKNRDR